MWWHTVKHGRGNWRMQWVASTLHTTSERGVSSITTADAHTSADSSRLNWRPTADLNGLVSFTERRNLVSACVPSHFKPSLQLLAMCWTVIGFETRWTKEIFCATNFSRSTLGTTQPPIQCVTGLLVGGKRAGGWHWRSIPIYGQDWKCIELYIRLLSLSQLACSEVTFTFNFTFSHHTTFYKSSLFTLSA